MGAPRMARPSAAGGGVILSLISFIRLPGGAPLAAGRPACLAFGARPRLRAPPPGVRVPASGAAVVVGFLAGPLNARRLPCRLRADLAPPGVIAWGGGAGGRSERGVIPKGQRIYRV